MTTFLVDSNTEREYATHMINFTCDACGSTACSPGFCITHDTSAVAAPVMTPALMGLEIQEAIMALYELRPSLDVWDTKQLEDTIERLGRVQHLLEGND